MRPLLLDLFCGAGGASVGYERAGFDVVGVDFQPQRYYPYGFTRAEAITYLTTEDLSAFAAIHASPPCQRWAQMTRCRPGLAEYYPDLITPIRPLLQATGLPYVIENVVQAPIDPTVILCGTQFGRRFQWHRSFECSFPVAQPACDHSIRIMNVFNTTSRFRLKEEFPDESPTRIYCQEKGITWTRDKEAYGNALPPAYTEHIGGYLMSYLKETHGAEYGTHCLDSASRQ